MFGCRRLDTRKGEQGLTLDHSILGASPSRSLVSRRSLGIRPSDFHICSNDPAWIPVTSYTLRHITSSYLDPGLFISQRSVAVQFIQHVVDLLYDRLAVVTVDYHTNLAIISVSCL